MNLPAAIILLTLFISLLCPISFLVYLVFVLPVFGSLALLPPDLAGGSSLTPESFAAFFLVIKSLTLRNTLKGAARTLINPRQLGLLGAFLAVAIIGAFTLPHVFNGAIRVYTMRAPKLDYVAPSIANYTQAAYLTLSTLTAAVIAVLIRQPDFTEVLPRAVLAGAYAVIATGLLDLITSYTGTSRILSVFYTANYGMSTGEILGAHRVLGLTPEPAAYGGMAASYCALLLFLRPVFPPRLWRTRVPLAGWGCGAMALLSTSSTAYVMMIVVLLAYSLYRTHSIGPEGRVVRRTPSRKILGLMAAGFAILIIMIFDNDLAAYFIKMIDTLIFQKQQTSSFVERSGWTSAAFNGFLESDGLGIGVGSVRTSNFFVNILASTGLLGAYLFGVFLWVIFTRKAPESNARASVFIAAAKLTLIPMFVGAAAAGTTPDFGIMKGVLFGLIAGLSQSPKIYAWVSPLARDPAKNPARNQAIKAQRA